MSFLTDALFPNTATLAAFVAAAVLVAFAAAFTAALVVEDDLTEPLRDRLWARFPQRGHQRRNRHEPEELEGSAFYDPDAGGTLLGNAISCVRCFGVWANAAWWAAWILVPGVSRPAAVFCAVCQLQRWANTLTRRSSGSPLA